MTEPQNPNLSTDTDGPRIYVASCLENWERVRDLIKKLQAYGITITYDWSTWGKQLLEGYVDGPKTNDDLKEIALNEVVGVKEADVVLAVMPGTRGTHFELAIAWMLGIPIIMLMDKETASHKTSFHYLDRITRYDNEGEAIAKTVELAKAAAALRPYHHSNMVVLVD